MKKQNFLMTLVIASTLAAGVPLHHFVYADESVGNKMKDSADDAGDSMKKTGRKIKRKARDATGNSSTKENVKDSMNNASDEINTDANKAKRKTQ